MPPDGYVTIGIGPGESNHTRIPSQVPCGESIMNHEIRDSKRVASTSLRGYWYQILFTVLRWLELPMDAYLVVEGNEDIDSVAIDLEGIRQVEEQIKYRSASPSWTNVFPVLFNFLKAFHRHHERGTRFNAVLRTNIEFNTPGQSQVERWVRGETPEVPKLFEELRVRLPLNGDAAHERALDYIVQNGLGTAFVGAVIWACSAPGPDDVEQELLRILKGRTRRIPPEGARDGLIMTALRRAINSDVERRLLRKLDADILINDQLISQAVRDFGSDSKEPVLCIACESIEGVVVAVIAMVADADRLARQIRDRAALVDNNSGAETSSVDDEINWLLASESDFVAYASVLRSRCASGNGA